MCFVQEVDMEALLVPAIGIEMLSAGICGSCFLLVLGLGM